MDHIFFALDGFAGAALLLLSIARASTYRLEGVEWTIAQYSLLFFCWYFLFLGCLATLVAV